MLSPSRFLGMLCLFAGLVGAVWSDGPADNQAKKVRPIPPPGIEIEPSVIEALRLRCEAVRTSWRSLSSLQLNTD